MSVINKSRRRSRMRNRYEEAFLDLSNFRTKAVKRYWKLKYFAIILISYVIFASPWICKQIHDGTFDSNVPHQKFFGDAIVLMIYQLTFYVPSAIIVYLWYKKIKSEKLMRKLYKFAQMTRATSWSKRSRPVSHVNRSHLNRVAARRVALRRNGPLKTEDEFH